MSIDRENQPEPCVPAGRIAVESQGGYRIMQSYFQSALPTNPPQTSGLKSPRQRGELIYQAVTIAAMLIVLVSVWVF
jgi:hypothetical protein